MIDRVHLLESIRDKLRRLYGEDRTPGILRQIQRLIDPYPQGAQQSFTFSERNALIIAYGDHLHRDGEAPLATLGEALDRLRLPVSGLHLLPFYPYSSDDGFSVIDYKAVDPALGSWAGVHALCHTYDVMFDGVFNHISARSDWFQAFLRGEAPYSDFFITVDPATDLSRVTRPRTLPLLTRFDTANGSAHVWTTFSSDQVDLNYANPDLLIAVLDVLLFYIAQGAQLIRLDAIAFLWKQIGTSCIHLPETHLIIQLMRDVLDIVSPGTPLITETNVPQPENLSYFGDGSNEAQLVYQFPLPPLILHTLHSGDARRISEWAKTVSRISDRCTYFNFTASHDGIGLRPVSGILTDDEIAALVQSTLAHGGFVSYKSNPDGTQSPYELNITYFDAITNPAVTGRDPQMAVDRFIVSQAMMLAFVGVPGIYLSSLFGGRNDRESVEATGHLRAINRRKLDADQLLATLADPTTLRAKVFARYHHLLEVRASEPAFHPLGTQTVLEFDPHVFALMRVSPDGKARVLTLHNVSGETVTVALAEPGVNRLDGRRLDSQVTLAPYDFVWMALDGTD